MLLELPLQTLLLLLLLLQGKVAVHHGVQTVEEHNRVVLIGLR